MCDSAGPMVKSVQDLANLLQAMVDPSQADCIPKGGYVSALSSSWDGIRIGCLDPDEWSLSDAIAGRDDNFNARQVIL